MAPHSSTLAWKIPWTEEPGRLQFMGSLRVGHDSVTSLSHFTFMHWRRKWQPTPVFSWWAAVYGVAQSRTRRKQLSKALGTNKRAEWEAGLRHNLKNSPHSEVPKRRCQQRTNKWLVGRREFQEQNGKLCWKLLRDLVRQDGNVLTGGRDTRNLNDPEKPHKSD